MKKILLLAGCFVIAAPVIIASQYIDLLVVGVPSQGTQMISIPIRFIDVDGQSIQSSKLSDQDLINIRGAIQQNKLKQDLSRLVRVSLKPSTQEIFFKFADN